MSDKGIKAVLEAAINVDRPIVDLSAIRTGRSRQPAIAEERAFEALKAGIFPCSDATAQGARAKVASQDTLMSVPAGSN